MNFNKFLYKFLQTAVILFIILLPFWAMAASLGINILPAKIFITAEKGESADSSIFVTNPNDFPIEISVEVENFTPGIIPGDVEFVLPIEGEASLADWIVITESFPLIAKERKEILFQIQTPENVSSGGHYAAIFFKATPTKITEGTGPLHISSRVGSLVMLTVPGEISRGARISEFAASKFVIGGPINFEILVANTGTTHFKTEGNILIKNWLGREIAGVGVEEKIVLPAGSQVLKAIWPVNFLLGFYKADLTIFVSPENKLLASTSFFIFPWKQTLILLVIVGIIIFGIRFCKRKFKIVRR